MLRRLALTLSLAITVTACKPSPAKIELATALPPLVLAVDPLPLKFRVLDKDGKAIEPAPELRVEARPTTVGTVQGGLLTPIMNGDLSVVVTAPNGLEATFPVRVRIADRAELSCARESCSFLVGDEIVLGAKLYSADELLKIEPPTWTARPAGILKDLGGGRWTALEPGEATVSFAVGAAEAKRVVYVSSPVDRLELTCPAIFTVDARCAVRQGKRVTLEVHALGRGKEVHDPQVQWSTRDESIATVVNGTVDAVGAGQVSIVATSGAVTSSIAIEVLPGCVGPWSPLGIRTGTGWDDVLRLSCQGFNPKMCLDRGLQANGGAFDGELLESCCCKREDRHRGR